jgi:hypothetical protein
MGVLMGNVYGAERKGRQLAKWDLPSFISQLPTTLISSTSSVFLKEEGQ